MRTGKYARLFFQRQKSDPRHPTLYRILRILLPLAFWLAVWQVVSMWVGLDLLLPSPVAVARRFVELAITADFWTTTGLTLVRIFCGALGGVLLGMICALLTCRFRVADWLLSPALRVVRTVPVACFIILILLWVKKSYAPAVISALMVLPVMWESISSGWKSADPQLLELCRTYRMSRRRTLRYVRLPALRPHAASGLCNAAGLAWKSGVAAEVLCIPKHAIGTQVYYAKLYLDTSSLFAWTITVVLLSLILERLLRFALRANGGKTS